ncbi:unnamed protein product, partial [Iphiclides podalirius]
MKNYSARLIKALSFVADLHRFDKWRVMRGGVPAPVDHARWRHGDAAAADRAIERRDRRSMAVFCGDPPGTVD